MVLHEIAGVATDRRCEAGAYPSQQPSVRSTIGLASNEDLAKSSLELPQRQGSHDPPETYVPVMVSLHGLPGPRLNQEASEGRFALGLHRLSLPTPKLLGPTVVVGGATNTDGR